MYYLTGDQEGTQTLEINSTTLAVSERFYDSYGSPVGTATGAWPGGQGFQDGTTDSATDRRRGRPARPLRRGRAAQLQPGRGRRHQPRGPRPAATAAALSLASGFRLG